jgi:ABC-type Fe3+-hydroxamate transport system substrate-binding protein
MSSPQSSQPRVLCLSRGAFDIVRLLGAEHLLLTHPNLSLDLAPRANQIDEPDYRPNPHPFHDLNPDLILTDATAFTTLTDLPASTRLPVDVAASTRTLRLASTTLEGVLDDIFLVADALGLAHRAAAEVVKLRERLFAAQEYVNPFADPHSVAFIDQTDPLHVAGDWIPQLIERAGGYHPLNPTYRKENAGAAIGPQLAERIASPRLPLSSRDSLAASAPDWVFICPRGATLTYASQAARELAQHDWFQRLPAFQSQRVFAIDGHEMFTHPSPKLVNAFEFLVALLNNRSELIPANFPFAPLA